MIYLLLLFSACCIVYGFCCLDPRCPRCGKRRWKKHCDGIWKCKNCQSIFDYPEHNLSS